jgi:hypothetical protein
VENRGCFKMFAGGGRPGQHKDARADNGADSKSSQRPRTKRFL